MKNIVFIIESLQCGGAERSLVTLLQNFDFKKFNVELILFLKGGAFEKFVPKEVNVVYISPFETLNAVTKIIKRVKYRFLRISNNHEFHGAQLYWKVYGNNIRNYNKTYDIAIAYNQGFSTYYVAEKIKAKTKYAWLNIDYKKAGYNINFDISKYEYIDKVVAVSKECENSFLNELNSIKKKIQTTIIKDITDVEIVNKLSLEHPGIKKESGSINLCSVGRLANQKGWPLAIEALSILKIKGYKIKWYIIGEGPQRNEIEKLIKEKKLETDFILLGYKENPHPYVKSCNIYVQTSLFEGLGLTVIEAAILQKPIVTTNFPTASTIIKNEETGLICEMSPKAIASSIERYLNDSKLKDKVVRNLLLVKNNDKKISLIKIKKLLNV